MAGASRGVGSALSAVIGVVSGVAPHVLHHVGPLAGTALLAGTGGTLLFGVAGFALSIPMLLRLRSRFGSWSAPAAAAVIFVAVYLASALWIGPALTGSTGSVEQPSASAMPSDHMSHH